MDEITQVTIVGLGLVGGSVAMALSQGRIVERVIGVDKDPEALRIALHTHAVNSATKDLKEGLKGSDLVILATPLSTMYALAPKMKPHLKEGCIVTDVGSTKEYLVKELEHILHPNIRYVGGHPMAGSERGGIQAADRYLFENAVYILTPTINSEQQAVSLLKNLLMKIGARVLTMTPHEHDNIIATVSHLPHLAASALVNTAGYAPEVLNFAAGGFRDTTRVASSESALWRDILAQNSHRVLKALKRFEEQLVFLRECIEAEDFAEIERYLTNAKKLREHIPQKQKGFLPSIYEVVVTVPDRPGMIGEMANILGKDDINIIDIEILRVREGEGGTIRLGFQSFEIAQAAEKILRQKGIIAKVR